MSVPNDQPTTILVVGDAIIDHHLYEGERPAPGMLGRRGVRAVNARGGAGTLARLIDAVAKKLQGKVAVHDGSSPPGADARPSHAYATWRPHPADGDPKKMAWRATLLGYGDDAGSADTGPPEATRSTGPINADVLVIDDAGLAFRTASRQESWGLGTAGAEPSAIVLKLSAPVARGDLWLRLTGGDYRDRLVCVVSVDDLRLEQARIRPGVSWERIVEDLRQAILGDPVLGRLSSCRHLVVTISRDGALWIDNDLASGKVEARLIFDAARAEGDWSADRPGQVTGFLTCMTASVAAAIAEVGLEGATSAVLTAAIRRGIDGMRDLDRWGHGLVGAEEPNGFPLERIAGVLAPETDASPGSGYTLGTVLLPWSEDIVASDRWMILESSQVAEGYASPGAILGIARNIVVSGPEAALGAVPHARFGDLTVTDRQEIEALRGIREIMQRFKADPAPRRPLCIGVFGPPAPASRSASSSSPSGCSAPTPGSRSTFPSSTRRAI